jgi:hypothetical protein
MHILIHIIIIAIKIALNDVDNFKDTCINTAIDTISATIASTSKNGNYSDGMIAFRVQSSAWGKGTLMPAATFDACKLLTSNKKRNRQEIKENEERRRK